MATTAARSASRALSSRIRSNPSAAPISAAGNSLASNPRSRNATLKLRASVAVNPTRATERHAAVDLTVSAAGDRGIRSSNTEPRPGRLSASSRPAIMSTSRLQMAKPKPVPPNCRVVELSACWNG